LPKKKAEVSMRVADIMEVPPVTVTEETTIDDAAKLMWEKNVGSVIVVDEGGQMHGIVTEKDVVFSVSKSMTGKGIPVSSIMSRTQLRASPREGIATAVEKMRKAGVRHLPVVEKNGSAVGMISMRDAFEISEPLLKLVLRSTKKRRAHRGK
jgi:CBS domain-containing protein